MKNNFENAIEDLKLIDFAVGNDLVFLPDFYLSFTELFKAKVYSDEEIAYCDRFNQPLLRYASTWAAKEAVYKAVKQISERPLAFKNIQVRRAKIAGVPEVFLPEEYDFLRVSLSISHDGDYACAIALVKRRDD